MALDFNLKKTNKQTNKKQDKTKTLDKSHCYIPRISLN